MRLHVQLIRVSFLFLLTAVALHLFALESAADNRSSKSTKREVPCPSVVADRRDGVFYRYSKRAGAFPFKCFVDSKSAQRKGFESKTNRETYDYTGWYRLSVKLVKDTCNPNTTLGAGPVLFLQVKQNDAGVFGQFCPNLGSFSGIKSGPGIVMSGVESFSEPVSDSMCDDGKLQVHKYVEMTRLIDSNPTFSVTYKQLSNCTSPGSGSVSCVREYVGIAFHETHTIWPGVSDNITELAAGCTTALKRCVNCHPSLPRSE